jgi:molecular chaperone HscB
MRLRRELPHLIAEVDRIDQGGAAALFFMNIQDNHFALFGLLERFGLDAVALDRAYREVQTQVHPDRFAGSGATEQRIALQWATRANEAYRVLRDPLQRAIYLCTLRGQDPADEQNTKMPQPFLMQQLEWREALDDAKANGDVAAIDGLRAELATMRATLQDDVTHALDRDGDALLASERVRLWMFVERFGEDVQDAKRQIEASVH